jgi:hypothetical protein
MAFKGSACDLKTHHVVIEVNFLLFPFDNLRGNIDFGRSSVPHFTALALPRHAMSYASRNGVRKMSPPVIKITNLPLTLPNTANKLLINVHKQTWPPYKAC